MTYACTKPLGLATVDKKTFVAPKRDPDISIGPDMFASRQKRAAFSLLELLAVVTILGIIAAIIVPRVSVSSASAKSKVRDHQKATINAAVERYYVEMGVWPANDLSDIGANTTYFPEGVPPNPVDNSAYTLNATTHRVN